jgi:hypothetical protein
MRSRVAVTEALGCLSRSERPLPVAKSDSLYSRQQECSERVSCPSLHVRPLAAANDI